MVAAGTETAATRAISSVIAALATVGLTAGRDAGAFHPQPTGILVGLPAMTARGLAYRTFTVPVHVVSGVPLNTMGAVDDLYAIADAAVGALGVDGYAPAEWGGGPNLDPLPSLLLSCVVTIAEVP